MSGLGRVRAIDRHFSQTTVQRTPIPPPPPLKNRRRAPAPAMAAGMACPPAGRSAGPEKRRWGERLRSAVAANISTNMMQYGFWGADEQYL